MKKTIAILLLFHLSLGLLQAQTGGKNLPSDNKDKAFQAYLYNKEFEVYLRINFYEQNIIVPGQELYGELPGYLGKERNSFCWVITSAKVIDEQKAEIALINDYGSEDLTASLTRQNDSTYVLRQLDGSTLKVPKNSRWQKLPKLLELKRK
jgi:hypothetical protein